MQNDRKELFDAFIVQGVDDGYKQQTMMRRNPISKKNDEKFANRWEEVVIAALFLSEHCSKKFI